MKLPNGYGSVWKLSGNRRRPYVAEKTETWIFDDNAQKIKQKRVVIGYYATRAQALQALADYNARPYDVKAAKITFSEVFAEWSSKKYVNTSKSSIHGYNAAYKLCGALYNMPMQEIKLKHLQAVVDNSGKNTPTLRRLKLLFSQLFQHAIINEYITRDRDLTAYVDIKAAGNPNALSRAIFTSDEITRLWDNVAGNIYLQTVLMLIYSGVRVSELLELKKADVHITEQWFYIRHSKTPSGVRAVPIADKVKPFFEFWLNQAPACDTLLSTPAALPFTYNNYKDAYFVPLLSDLDITHLPHDTRHTCISMLAAADVNPTITKKIVGHSGAQSLTERVYTHFDITPLLDAINKI